MSTRTLLLVTQYDGGAFAGWQRQPAQRTVQGEMERVLSRLCDAPTSAIAAGRTDAGVHAHGQGVGVQVPERWDPARLRRGVNALLPGDVWIASVHEMHAGFHARRSALARRYRYLVGTDEAARSPFRRRYEWGLDQPLERSLLVHEAGALMGEHTFRAFAVSGTAPVDDPHRCVIHDARWTERDGGWTFEIEANRFLHHMVRFLVSTMVQIAQGRLPRGTMARLLARADNAATPAPAPPQGLSFGLVRYPAELYVASR